MAKKKEELDTLLIEKLVVEEDFQARADGTDEDQVDQMVEALKKKAGCLPRIRVTHVKDLGLVVTDGFGRVKAHKKAGIKSIQAVVKKGTRLDAILDCASANKDQLGRHRTNADKRRAVDMVLRELEESDDKLTTREIADLVGCSHTLVGDRRNALGLAAAAKGDLEKSEDIPLDDRKPSTPKAKAPEPKKESSSQSWEQMPLDEFLKADGFMWEGLKRSRISTAGDLLNRILAGETFGLDNISVKDLRRQCETLRDGSKNLEEVEKAAKPKESGEEKGFNFRAFDSAMRVIANAPDQLANETDPSAMERRQCIEALTRFHTVWDKWVQRLYPKGLPNG